MKIRTDFVTNSSSSSFIAIKVKTAYKTIKTEIDSGDMQITPGKTGCFDISEEDLKDAVDIDKIICKMCGWFYDMMDDPQCWYPVEPSWSEEGYKGPESITLEDCRQILRCYGDGDNNDLLSVKMEDVKKISFFSRVIFWDVPYGARLIEYDYDTGRMTITKPSIPDNSHDDDDHDEEIDSYGDELYDQFLNS